MQATITLQLDQDLLAAAQNYAKQQGTSISQLVAEYFARLERQHDMAQPEQLPPITQSLLGALRGAQVDEHDYTSYLEEKYR